MQAIRRPGSEVKTVRQVVKGLESEGIHISDTLVKAVREERELSPPVEPTPLFKPEVVEVEAVEFRELAVKEAVEFYKGEDTGNLRPVKFEDVWQLTGEERQNGKARLSKLFDMMVAAGTARINDMLEISSMLKIGNGAMREGSSYEMTVNVLDQWLADAPGIRGVKARKVLLDAYKEFIDLKASITRGEYTKQEVPDLYDPEQLLKYFATKQIELSANVKELETKNVELVAEVTELSDHLDALSSEVEDLKPKADDYKQITDAPGIRGVKAARSSIKTDLVKQGKNRLSPIPTNS